MKPCPVVVSVLFFVAFLAVGCAVPAVAPAPGAPAAAETSETVAEELPAELYLKEEACRSHIAFSPEDAFQYYQGAVLWTFNLNFLESGHLDANGSPDEWLGCLRFYFRVEPTAELSGTFTGTLASAFLIPCAAQGAVHTETIPDQIKDTDGGELGSTLTRVGVFEGGHFECPLNVSQMAGALRQSPDLEDALNVLAETSDKDAATSGLEALLNTYGQMQDHFSAAAGIRSLSGGGTLNPLLSYMPISMDDAYAIEFGVLSVVANQAEADIPEPLTFLAFLQERAYQPDLQESPPPGDCTFTVEQPLGVYVWFNFGSTSRHAPDKLGFTSERISTLGAEYCGQAKIAPQLASDYLSVWTGEAIVFVGYNPETGEPFQGSLYEVWFDPDLGPKPGG